MEKSKSMKSRYQEFSATNFRLIKIKFYSTQIQIATKHIHKLWMTVFLNETFSESKFSEFTNFRWGSKIIESLFLGRQNNFYNSIKVKMLIKFHAIFV